MFVSFEATQFWVISPSSHQVCGHWLRFGLENSSILFPCCLPTCPGTAQPLAPPAQSRAPCSSQRTDVLPGPTIWLQPIFPASCLPQCFFQPGFLLSFSSQPPPTPPLSFPHKLTRTPSWPCNPTCPSPQGSALSSPPSGDLHAQLPLTNPHLGRDRSCLRLALFPTCEEDGVACLVLRCMQSLEGPPPPQAGHLV